MFTSKKALTAIASVLALLSTKCGFIEISTNEMLTYISPLMAYIVGQGLADVGKERAIIENDTNKEH